MTAKTERKLQRQGLRDLRKSERDKSTRQNKTERQKICETDTLFEDCTYYVMINMFVRGGKYYC